MKKWLSISLLLVILLPELTKIWIVFDFKINQDFIAEVLCINKDEPTSGCNGKCHLAKQLKKVDPNDQDDKPDKINQKIEILLFLVQSNNILHEPLIPNAKKSECTMQFLFAYTSHLSDIFRPPKMLIA